MDFYHLGLTGYSLGHSLSPLLHRAFLEASGLQGEYKLYPVPPDQDSASLISLLMRLRRGELHGLNVTIPYKGTVLPYCDVFTRAARAVGAVNTLYMSSGQLMGDNTDLPGFLADLERLGWKTPIGNGQALMLGAGGAARAAALALAQSGWQVSVAARRLEQAQDFINSLLPYAPTHSLQAVPYPAPDQTSPSVELIINATPVGMWPHTSSSPWPEGLVYPPSAKFYDLVYNPAATQMMQSVQRQGHPVSGGLGMLVEQAALAFAAWTGHRPATQGAYAAAQAALQLQRMDKEK